MPRRNTDQPLQGINLRRTCSKYGDLLDVCDYLATEGMRLGKAKVVGMARSAATDETWFGRHITQVLLVPNPPRGTDLQIGLIDLA